MKKKILFVVESPTKAKSISKMLDDNYIIIHTNGHICDIKNKFDVSKNRNFKWDLEYELLPSGKKFLSSVRKIKKDIDHVILATDFDREGEVISYNIKYFLTKKLKLDLPYKRSILREINKNSLLYSMQNFVDIDKNLVSSQEARRTLDKMIGFTISPMFNTIFSNKNSVGRVKSISMILISERTKEHVNFVPEPIYSLCTYINNFKTRVFFDKKELFSTQEEIKKISENSPKILDLISSSKHISLTKQIFPLKTSTLQKSCFNSYGFSATKVMSISQKLFEGKKIKKDIIGLITYPRTDSIRINRDFLLITREYIKNKYQVTQFSDLESISKKQLNIQDAHECIRPTDISLIPEEIQKYLEENEYKVYKTIFYTFLASCFTPSKIQKTKYIYEKQKYSLILENNEVIYPGCFVVEKCKEMFCNIPKNTDIPSFLNVNILQDINYTKPKSLFNETSLISFLEKNNIGRPSTYSTIIPSLEKKAYIYKENKKLLITKVGEVLGYKLQQNFSSIFNINYTQNMENKLKSIYENSLKKEKFLDEFFSEFYPLVTNFKKEIDVLNSKELKNFKCYICNAKTFLFLGYLGPYVKCENKHINNIEKNIDYSKSNIVVKRKIPKFCRIFFLNSNKEEDGIYYFSLKDKKCLILKDKKFYPIEIKELNYIDIKEEDVYFSFIIF